MFYKNPKDTKYVKKWYFPPHYLAVDISEMKLYDDIIPKYRITMCCIERRMHREDYNESYGEKMRRNTSGISYLVFRSPGNGYREPEHRDG